MTSLAEASDGPQPAPRKRRSPAEHGTRLDPEWRRSPVDIEWQQREGVPDAFARLSTQAFKNYWLSKPGAAAKKLDWSLTWRTWILRDWMGITERRRSEWLRIDAERKQGGAQSRPAVPEALQR